MSNLSQSQQAASSQAMDIGHQALSDEGPIVLMLNENGLIINCNETATKRLGCMTSQVVWQPISNFLPNLAGTVLTQNGQINPRLRFLSRIGHLFDVKSPDGEAFQCRVFFNEVENYGRRHLCLVISPASQAGMPFQRIYYPN